MNTTNSVPSEPLSTSSPQRPVTPPRPQLNDDDLPPLVAVDDDMPTQTMQPMQPTDIFINSTWLNDYKKTVALLLSQLSDDVSSIPVQEDGHDLRIEDLRIVD